MSRTISQIRKAICILPHARCVSFWGKGNENSPSAGTQMRNKHVGAAINRVETAIISTDGRVWVCLTQCVISAISIRDTSRPNRQFTLGPPISNWNNYVSDQTYHYIISTINIHVLGQKILFISKRLLIHIHGYIPGKCLLIGTFYYSIWLIIETNVKFIYLTCNKSCYKLWLF